MVEQALAVKPEADRKKLHESIQRASFTVGLTRLAIADVVQAEIETLAMLKALGDVEITIDFMAGLVAAELLIRTGKHVTDKA